MRGPDCNKFVPYDTEVEPEEDTPPEIIGTEFTASYRRVLTCGECGAELKESTIEVSHDFGDQVDEGDDEADEKKRDHEHEFEVQDCDVEPTTETRGRGRRAPVFYGVECTVMVKCSGCREEVTFTASDAVQASSMDETT